MWIGVVLVLYMKFDLILWYLLHQCVNNELQLSWFLTFENYSMYLIISVCLMNWICQRKQDRCKLLHNKACDTLNTCFDSWILGNALFTLIEHNTLSSYLPQSLRSKIKISPTVNRYNLNCKVQNMGVLFEFYLQLEHP